MVERRSPKPDVEGSSPSGREFYIGKIMENKFIQSIMTYFRGVKIEWGKITWPEKHQVFVETVFVLAIIIAFTLFVYVIDLIFKFGLSFLIMK